MGKNGCAIHINLIRLVIIACLLIHFDFIGYESMFAYLAFSSDSNVDFGAIPGFCPPGGSDKLDGFANPRFLVAYLSNFVMEFFHDIPKRSLRVYGLSEDDDPSINYERENVKFEVIESVNGTGFANSRLHMENPQSAILSSHKMGSGSYSSNSTLEYNSVNESDDSDDQENASENDDFFDGYSDDNLISLKSGNLSVTYAQTSLSLPRRNLDFDAKWSDVTNGSSIESDTSFLDSFRYVTKINKTDNLILDDTDAHIESEAGFRGTADIRYQSQISNYIESYIGAVEISRDISADKFVSSAKGLGFADIDRTISKSGLQRTYEKGSGRFSLDEIIEPEEDYIARNLTVAYLPVNISISAKNPQNLKVEWSEGLTSQEKDVGQIIERFTGIKTMWKSTIISQPASVQTEAGFSGKGGFGTSSDNFTTIEEYTGNYTIKRNVTVEVLPRYRKPHIYVTEAGHLDSIGCKIVRYNITILNDGNKEVGPIDVTDAFPAGTYFIKSSGEPIKLTSHHAKWSIDSPLLSGESISIELVLGIEREVEKITNRVTATAYYSDKKDMMHHTASQHNSSIDVNPGACNFAPVSILMSATNNITNSSRINYSVTIQNNATNSMGIDLTCMIPSGAMLLKASEKPAKVEANNLTWSFDLASGKSKNISYEVDPKESRFTFSRATFRARSEDGKEQFTGEANITLSVPEPTGIFVERVIDDWLPGGLIEVPETTNESVSCPCVFDPNETRTTSLPTVKMVYANRGYNDELSCC